MHEQNARAGMANKLGARWASMIGTAYAQTGLKPRKGVEAERVGLPLRAEIAAIAHGMEQTALPQDNRPQRNSVSIRTVHWWW